jgi:hypothetical protein
MKAADLLTSPPPATGWSLDGRMAVVVRRQARGELRSAAVEVPEGTFEVGPVGLQDVDQDKLRPILNRLQQEVEGSRRAAVVVPSGWLRSHVLEFEQLPRRRQDIHEMLVWRLKKLLPVPPLTLRLAPVVQPAADGPRRLLVMAGVDRAIAELEAAFESVDVAPGIITSRIFALVDGSVAPGPILTVQQETGVLSLLLLIDDQPRVVRTKLMAGGGWAAIEREVSLTVGFIESQLGIEQDLALVASFEDESLADQFNQWVAATPRVSRAQEVRPSFVFDGTAVRERARSFRLDPIVNVLSGGVR